MVFTLEELGRQDYVVMNSDLNLCFPASNPVSTTCNLYNSGPHFKMR